MLLLAVPAAAQLVDEVRIPAGDWKYREITLSRPARISVYYDVLSGSAKVRAALMLRDDLERMSSDLPGAILVTPEGRGGYFIDRLARQGDYAVVLDNQDGREAATVRLRVQLNYATRGSEVGRLSPRRQATVIALSCLAFLGIVGFSARQLLKAMR